MQRVVIENYPYYAALQALDAKVALIVKHFPPSVASLYALPKAGADGRLEWWSPLGGQPTLYANLDEQQQALLLQKYAQRQQSLQLLIDELKKLGRSEQANTLHSLLGEPNLDNLYSINDDPVLVRWGPPPPPPAPKVEPVTTPAPRVEPKPAPPARVTNVYVRGRHILSVLLLLLLALLLGWLAYWWLSSSNTDNYSCLPAGTIPPEFVTVFDTSGSMALNLQISQAEEEWFAEFINSNYSGDEYNERIERLLSEPKRETVAKNAIIDMVEDLHPAIDTRLVTFAGCFLKTHDHGIFTKQQRPELLKRITELEVDDGTPLAASLAYAASKVDGRNNDAMIVMFIDGADGCGGDVCAVAETIGREQPRLKVDVVNIGNAASSSCIASATGGRVYDSTDAKKISTVLAKATQEVAASTKCNAIF